MTTQNLQITEEHKRLVRESLPNIQELSWPIGKLFFGRLFQIDPSLRPMFHQDLAVQGQKTMEMLTMVVNNLERFETLSAILRALGQRHVAYGVRAEHYPPVENALLWALGVALDTDFYPELKAAWRTVLETVSAVMQEGAAQLPPG